MEYPGLQDTFANILAFRLNPGFPVLLHSSSEGHLHYNFVNGNWGVHNLMGGKVEPDGYGKWQCVPSQMRLRDIRVAECLVENVKTGVVTPLADVVWDDEPHWVLHSVYRSLVELKNIMRVGDLVWAQKRDGVKQYIYKDYAGDLRLNGDFVKPTYEREYTVEAKLNPSEALGLLTGCLKAEVWREYDLKGGGVYRISNPRVLYYKKDYPSHRVVDNNGIVHYIPGYTAIRWLPRDGKKPVQF